MQTGKHGHAKCKFTAIDIFDGSKHEMLESSTHNVTVSTLEDNLRTTNKVINYFIAPHTHQ